MQLLLFPVLLSFFTSAHSQSLRGLGDETSTATTSSSITCLILQIDVEKQDEDNDASIGQENESLICMADTVQGQDMAYGIQLPPNLDTTIARGSLVTFSTAIIDFDNAMVSIPEDSTVTHHNSNRRLVESQGSHDILVLRVTYKGIAPTITATQLAGRLFGIGASSETVNVISQLDDCSFHKLQIRPAQSSDGRVVNGVAEVVINDSVSGDNSVRLLENLVVIKANNMFGTVTSQFDHILLVMPDANLKMGGGSYLAYASMNGPRSVFHNDWAGRLSAVAHELGHNMNLAHAGQGTQPYGDITGFMGFGIGVTGGPKMCFNAQNHWTLGWFDDRKLSLTQSDLPWGGYLAAFVDYQATAPSQHVLIRIGDSDVGLYLQFNRAKGINVGTRALPDTVVIVSDDGTVNPTWGIQSWQVGGIMVGRTDVDPTYIYSKFDGTADLIVRVCTYVKGSPDVVRLSMHLANGKQSTTCNEAQAPTSGQSSCTDSPTGRFFANNNLQYKDCEWLSTRPTRQEQFCLQGHEAYAVCPDTCDACGN